MTASAPIVGTARIIPDAASAAAPASGVAAHANFRSVLEQYQSSRESVTDPAANHAAPPKKQKDSATTETLPANAAANPVANPVVPQALTPPEELPRVILPFTTSITLRQDTAVSPDDATLDSTTATDPTPQPSRTASGTATALLSPVIVRSTIDMRSVPPVSDSNSLPTSAATQPKAQAKELAKLSKEAAPSPATAAMPASYTPSDPSTPLLPLTTSSTLTPATTAAQPTPAVSEAPEPVSIPVLTSTLDRRSAYQFHSSPEQPVATLTANRASQEPQKTSDPSTAAAITVPIPATNTVQPPPPVHLPASAPAPRQSAPVAQDNSTAATQDSSAAPSTDPRTAMPPVTERADATAAAPMPQGSLAFAARLTPTEETPAPAPDTNRVTDSQPRPQSTLPTAVTARPIITEADVQSGPHNGESGSPSSDQEKMGERFAKLETLLPQTHAATAEPSTPAPSNHASSASPLTVAARMDQVPEAPAAPSSGNHDITIRIPDATTDQGTAVRFVERAGEVHVSVRTSDTEMAQTLRGGLNDLVNRLEDGGIRTQVWQPGAGASTSQNDSQQPFADPDGSNGRQYSSASDSEAESKQQNKPRWVEELEDSIGNTNFKETTQLLWQA